MAELNSTGDLMAKRQAAQVQLDSFKGNPDQNTLAIAALEEKITTLSAQIVAEDSISKAYGDLKSLYENPDENAEAIKRLNGQIRDLSSVIIEQQKKILQQSDPENQPYEYDEKIGDFLNSTDFVNKAKVASWQPPSVSSEQQPPDTLSPPKWKKQWLQKSIDGTKWYNNHQVAHLTGQEVPVGGQELTDCLNKNKSKSNTSNASLSVSYLKVPDDGDPTLNHFVSFHIDPVKKEIIYFDSNGEEMSPEDRERVMKIYPDAKIMYLDQEGKKLSEEAAQAASHKIVRTQFDGHNCGVFSIEFTALMQKTSQIKDPEQKEAAIKSGIENLKNLDLPARRQTHEKFLKTGLPYSLPATPKLTRRQSIGF